VSAGGFTFDFIATGIQRLRQRRKRKKRLRELGIEDDVMAIDLGTRTTTNMTVSGLVVYGILKAVSAYFPDFPTDGLEEVLSAVVAYFVGRFTKSPVSPGAF